MKSDRHRSASLQSCACVYVYIYIYIYIYMYTYSYVHTRGHIWFVYISLVYVYLPQAGRVRFSLCPVSLAEVCESYHSAKHAFLETRQSLNSKPQNP